jgi:7-cyano-7-deazaguanine synthase in queuosine biosynthesis
MKHNITVLTAPEPSKRKETACLSLQFEGQQDRVPVDIDGAAILRTSRVIPNFGQDFLTIAACIYATDKAVARAAEEDKWTRDLSIQIPVGNPAIWQTVSDDLSECIGFLTGDRWEISFRPADKGLIQKKPRKRRVPLRRPTGSAVCLFSGGLDSFIGAIDWLSDNPTKKLLLVGHYDRHVAGPKKDQCALGQACLEKYGNRIELAQVQVGLTEGGADTNFRSRSLLFVALACYFAEIIGNDVPVLIPENGPIAINFPLTASRRGSCSTRTVHPYFIQRLNTVLRKVGMGNPIANPYELKTKGEMVDECKEPEFLAKTYMQTRSCAKINHREHWENTKARACGICVPCLFRRAALFRSGKDREVFGNTVENIKSLADTPDDLLALLAFLRSNLTDRQFAAGLLGNGSLPIDKLPLYVDMVKRMRKEVLNWLSGVGSKFLKSKLPKC